MKERVVSILHVEDNKDDVELLQLALKKAKTSCQVTPVFSKKEFDKVRFDDFDVVVCDYNLGEYNGQTVIETVRKHDPLKPIIVLTGTVGEELAVELLHSGANDFVLKSNFNKVPLAIKRVLSEQLLLDQRNKFHTELLEQKLVLDTIFDAFQNIIFLKDDEHRYIKVNRAFCEYTRKRSEEVIGKTNQEIFQGTLLSKTRENEEYVFLTGKQVIYEVDNETESGKRDIFEIVLTPIIDEGTVTGIVGECRNITEQKVLIENAMRAQSVLRQAERLTQAGSFEYDAEMDILHCSPNFKRMMNLRIEGDTISFRKFAQLVQEEDRELLIQGVNEAIKNLSEYYLQHRFIVEDRVAHYKLFLKPDFKNEKGNMFYGTVVDVTAEQENHIYIMEKQDEDRMEISRELHDNLGQKLTAVSMFISKISDGQPDNKDLAKAKDITHEAIDDLRFLMNSISAKSAIEHSLEYAVKKLQQYVPESMETQFEMKLEEEKLSNFVKSQVYRVVQEVLNNAVKYSNATLLKLSLKQNGSLLDMEIEDNGDGFSLEEGMKGHGLQNMTYRVQKSSGLINIDTKKGRGTKVVVKMPIK